MKKTEIYKYLILEAVNFKYMQDAENKIWDAIAYDEQLTDEELEYLSNYICEKTGMHFVF